MVSLHQYCTIACFCFILSSLAIVSRFDARRRLRCEPVQHWRNGKARAQPGPTFLFRGSEEREPRHTLLYGICSHASAWEKMQAVRSKSLLPFVTVGNGTSKRAVCHKPCRKAEPLLREKTGSGAESFCGREFWKLPLKLNAQHKAKGPALSHSKVLRLRITV